LNGTRGGGERRSEAVLIGLPEERKDFCHNLSLSTLFPITVEGGGSSRHKRGEKKAGKTAKKSSPTWTPDWRRYSRGVLHTYTAHPFGSKEDEKSSG